MPSSLLPSRSARNSESISPSSLVLVSSSCSRALTRKFLRFAPTGFFVIEFPTPNILRGRPGDRCVQVVTERLVDSRADELARLGVAREKYRAVDIRRLARGSPAHPRRASRHRTFNQHFEVAADEASILRERDFRLRGYQMCAPRSLDAFRHLVRHIEGRRIFFARVSENADAIELFVANEIHQPIEGGV